MGKALYRKYRSKSLDEIVGQQHITTALKNALQAQKVSHAYLFTGPRGVGKTSVARILAHAVNGLPYTEDATHIDIIEIDAASNRRIDEIRDLRDKVHIAPSSASFKVYIIDEVHMLTKEAFNALLKTLEEPPAHVIFILATTEVHKVPETIISRTQRFTFRPISVDDMVTQLKRIAKAEKLRISDEALQLIAEHSEGSFRDSISLLDQVTKAATTIDRRHVEAMLGLAAREAIEQLATALAQKDVRQVVHILTTSQQHGTSAVFLAKQLGRYLKDALIAGRSVLDPRQTISLLEQLLKVPVSPEPAELLELILLNAVVAQQPVTATSAQPPLQNDGSRQSKVAKSASSPPRTTTAQTQGIEEIWQPLLDTLKQQHNTLYGILRMASPVIENEHLVLECRFPFHKKRINEQKTQAIIRDILKQQTGTTYAVTARVKVNEYAGDDAGQGGSRATDPNAAVETISNIFGSAEVLES